MCSPSEAHIKTNNTSTKLINNNNNNINSGPSTDLQSNQQEHTPGSASIANLNSSSLTQMPFQQSSCSRGTSHKAYKKVNSPNPVIAGQERFTKTKSNSYLEHKFGTDGAISPRSTSDIWADPSNRVSPASVDYLRDNDVVLTPCTTLSTVPSRTPSEEDPDLSWRTVKHSLEIPDLDQPMKQGQAPTPVTTDRTHTNTNTYDKKKTSGFPRWDITKTSNQVPFDQRSPYHSKPLEEETLAFASPREPAPAADRKKRLSSVSSPRLSIPRLSSPRLSIQRLPATPNRTGHAYYGTTRPIYSAPQATMQGQYYYNQPQLLHHHSRRSPHHAHQQHSHYSNEPRSPYTFKHQNRAQSSHPHSNSRLNSPKTPTTPRQGHSLHRLHQHSSGPSGSSNAGNSRPTYEILKTLLRKKACLYEPGTSRAIALITWLVGRKLALSDGYFSRQHLQSGVHAVVADKIESGMITRTKVNRCMQIILNSCFHYIIPRPDGTEEKGDLFQKTFAKRVSDDMFLLDSLPRPWDDLRITEECLVNKGEEIKDSPVRCKGDSAAKRVVLLCFNENVRSAEDVLRCHNDFIRDAAITGDLHLSADEWRQFFSLMGDDSNTPDSATVCPTTPLPKAANGCDIPYLTFDVPLNISTETGPWCKAADSLGQMTSDELSKFRTTWCCKRYDHDHSLCRFAHVDVNGGWLRRNPLVHEYSAKMCTHITLIESSDSPLKGCHINACADGLQCKNAHSQEEIEYHPKCYKSSMCETMKNPRLNCQFQDICPKTHPENPRSPGYTKSPRNFAKRNNESPRRKAGCHVNTKHSYPDSISPVPVTSPIIYHKPAPPSEFEKTLLFPGLQCLYRRNCAMLYANFLGKNEALQKYSTFGDDWEEAKDSVERNDTNGKSFSLYSTIGGK